MDDTEEEIHEFDQWVYFYTYKSIVATSVTCKVRSLLFLVSAASYSSPYIVDCKRVTALIDAQRHRSVVSRILVSSSIDVCL